MVIETDLLLTIVFFFTVAMFYSSAGFGGGSSYLAILALFGFGQLIMRSTALSCNIAVVALSVVRFNKSDLLPSRKAGIISLCSVPFALWATQFHLEENYFFVLLALVLVLSAIGMFVSPKIKEKEVRGFRDRSTLIPIVFGMLIGFLSGLVGIGGGIFLAPILYFFNYEEPKKIAAITSFFILVNSVAGILGLAQSGQLVVDSQVLILLLLAVLVGGYLGSRAITHFLKPLLVKKITAFLILLVAIRLLWKYLPQVFEHFEIMN